MGTVDNLKRKLAVALGATAVLLLLVASVSNAAKVEPILIPGASNQGKDCSDQPGGQGWTQLKVTSDVDGTFSDGTLTVSVTYTQPDKVFNWTSNLGVDAVIVKGGSDGSYRYQYDPPSEQTSDTGLTTPGQNTISHINFCYDVEAEPEGSLTVVKHVVNDDGGTNVAGDWTMNVSGPTDVSFAGSEAGTQTTVDPGSYTVSESGPAGYALSYSGDCDSQGNVSVADGDNKTCTLTNDDVPPDTRPGTIVIEKQTIPDGYQPPQGPFQFTGEIVAALGDGESASKQVAPGTYTVTELKRDFWDVNIVCDDTNSAGDSQTRTATFNVEPGEIVRCVFTNTKLSLIFVKKETVPDGDPQVFDFTASFDADGFSLSDGQQVNSVPLHEGTYSVTESVPAGWVQTSAVCSDGSPPDAIVLGIAEAVFCTFTNTKVQAGRIIVEKQTSPDGDEQSFEFDASYGDGFSLSDGEQNDSGDLAPGTYSVSENLPDGWNLESAVCSDQSDPGSIELADGETVTCVFTNTKAGRIIIEKQTNPDGDEQSFEFSATYDEDGFSLSDGEQNDSGPLAPGTYRVFEFVPEGWDLTSSVCTGGQIRTNIQLAAGETVTCVVTNTKRGSIVVEKQTNPNGANASFSFSGDAAGAIGDGGQIVVANLEPGTYTSTEAAAGGWNLVSISCDDENSKGDLGERTASFDVEAGETVKCIFTNSQIATGFGAISVSKSADPTTLQEPGGPVTYSVRITNPSSVNITVTNVVDDKFGDLDDDGGSGCFDVPINLAPGAFSSCQFSKQITGVGGTSHVNTVTASGHDEFGHPLSGSDDARVDITARLIDLVIVKDATSPTPLNGTVNYTLTVTNKGPDTATNVQLADPAPAGITYQTASTSQGTCSVAPALITCSLGTIAPGQTVTISVTAKATQVGRHVNTATVTGSGGRETNPADNVDDAVTVVPAPLKPPTVTPKPKPKPKPEVCLTVTVTPKMIKADDKPDRVVVKVTAAGKRVKGAKVLVKGSGIRKTGRTNGKGIAVVLINAGRPGLITVSTLERQHVCGAKRIGVVGVFLPPLTG